MKNEVPNQSLIWIHDQTNWISDNNYKKLKFWFLITIGTLLNSVWERDFDIKKYRNENDNFVSLNEIRKFLTELDDFKMKHRRLRNELCHNQYACFFDTVNVKVFKTSGKKLTDQVNSLANSNTLAVLKGLLTLIK